MVKGTTKSGFRYSVDENILDSWQFVEVLRDVQQKDQVKAAAAVVDLIRLVLGEEQTQRLAKYLTKDGKYVSTETMLKEYKEIVGRVRNSKN